MSKFHPLKVASVARETRDAVALTFDVPPAHFRRAVIFTKREHFEFAPDRHGGLDGDGRRASGKDGVTLLLGEASYLSGPSTGLHS